MLNHQNRCKTHENIRIQKNKSREQNREFFEIEKCKNGNPLLAP